MAAAEESRNEFAKDFFNIIWKGCRASNATNSNVIISPASVHSCLMLAFMGSAGTTAEELRTSLKLGKGNKLDIAQSYLEFLTQSCSHGAKGPTLKIVNRLYVNSNLELQSEFNALTLRYFQAQAEALKFANAAEAAQKINRWVEEQTANKIRDLVQPAALSEDTSAIIINALYFKGKWAKPFTPETTAKVNFYVDINKHIEVDMMHQDDKFKYAELPELKAKALQLPFENSDIYMLIILPNEIRGIFEMEHKLGSLKPADIAKQMKLEHVDVALPKFSIEYDIELKRSLQQLGITEIFGKSSNLGELFTSSTGQRISAIRHRGYIDVNEAGCEAAAVTFMKIVPMCFNMNQKSFKVDHPFIFYIYSSKAVFFAGSYTTPNCNS